MNSDAGKITVVPAIEVTEGGGVRVRRTIGSPNLRNLDPFLLLDQIGSDDPEAYIAGFPSHPHRGFITFTYMIDGDMEHRDSMGNTGRLGPGGAQWMKAASGVIHSEMPRQEEGLLRGFQLWINLPAANKMDEPEYQEYRAAHFPVITEAGFTIKVLIGQYAGTVSPIQDEATQVQFLDVQIDAGKTFKYDLIDRTNTFLYLFEGSGELEGKSVSSYDLAHIQSASGTAEFTAGSEVARFLLVSGKPIGEPVVQYGPFVMNTSEEIHQAMSDLQSNNLVRGRAVVNRD